MKRFIALLPALILCACVPKVEAPVNNRAIQEMPIHENVSQDGVVCTADGVYPHVTGLASTQVERNINGYMDEYAHQVKTDMNNCTTQYADLIQQGETLTDTTHIEFHITRFDDTYLSVLLLRSSYLDGAAHPNNMIDSFVFDINTGQPIKLADLFTTGSNFMNVLEQRVQTAATEEDVGPYPSDTSKPIKTFYLTENTLVLADLFDVHALKAFEVKIPLSDLSDILR